MTQWSSPAPKTKNYLAMFECVCLLVSCSSFDKSRFLPDTHFVALVLLVYISWRRVFYSNLSISVLNMDMLFMFCCFSRVLV